MKQTFLPLLCLFLSLLFVCTVCAQEEADPFAVSEEMIAVLNANLDNLFPLNSLKKNFMEPAEALYSDVGPGTMVRKETENGKRKILLIANADGIRDHRAYEAIDDAYPSDFMMTMDVTVGDVFPERQGGCFIGFTENGISASSVSGSRLTISLLVDGKASEIYIYDPYSPSGAHIDLGEMAQQSSKLSIIHLTGHTYVYINGRYLGQFHDGRDGGFRLIYGSAVFTEGDTADCTFDNLLIRKVSVQ